VQGSRVLIDVFNPDTLTDPATDADILLTTHGHQDHIHGEFLDTFPGQQLYIQEGGISTDHVQITGIASAHTAFDHEDFPAEAGSNYIYIIEMGGLRIAHFGDIGQEEFTVEQMDALGEIDVALTQFVNSFSQMDMSNQKGFNLMTQLNPRLIIPTHGNGKMDAIEKAAEHWDAFAATAEPVDIKPADLTDHTTFVITGANAASMQTIFELPEWGG
jgi:L-ascorbate metabolism protein UlaG (beta-lactamase superfamily)